MSIVGTACNFSSKETKVKFSLDQKIEYRAHCHVKYHYEKLCKLVGNTLKENAEETVSCQIKIPEDATPTLHNCDIVRVQYCIKVCENNISQQPMTIHLPPTCFLTFGVIGQLCCLSLLFFGLRNTLTMTSNLRQQHFSLTA